MWICAVYSQGPETLHNGTPKMYVTFFTPRGGKTVVIWLIIIRNIYIYIYIYVCVFLPSWVTTSTVVDLSEDTLETCHSQRLEFEDDFCWIPGHFWVSKGRSDRRCSGTMYQWNNATLIINPGSTTIPSWVNRGGVNIITRYEVAGNKTMITLLRPVIRCCTW